MKQKDNKKKKTERIDLRVTSSQLRSIKRYSKKYNISASDYILNSIFYTPNYYRRELEFLQALTMFQNFINNIHDGNIDPSDTEKCQEELDKIWKEL
ncbi:MAG: hypothetical protein IJ794_00325 [Lachnospiraceae bacterium]|nr:hypothetical protein [Lachnospiraceae bacterium]